MTQFNISKADNDKHIVFGWANVAVRADGTQIEDYQGDIFDPEDLEEAAYKYVLDFRDAGEEHNPELRKKAKLIESMVFTREKQSAMGIPAGLLPEGWWIGFKVHDNDTWAKIKNGEYTMFSVEGQGVREPVKKSRNSATFKELLQKYNPHHDPATGRFSSGGGSSVSGNSSSENIAPSDSLSNREGAIITSAGHTLHRVSGQEFWDNAHKAYDSMPDAERWRVGIDDHSPEELEKEAKCYSTERGSSFAVKNNGDMVGLCKIKGDPVRAKELIEAAVEAGGTKMDAFGKDLYELYTRNGFEPVSHCNFTDEYAPDAWVRANGFKEGDTSWHGTPNSELESPRESIVFYKYTGEKTSTTYADFLKNTPVSEDYDVAADVRNEAMK